MGKITILNENHGLTLLRECKFCDFFKSMFYSLERLFIYLERHLTVLFGIFWIKRKNRSDYNFWQKPLTNPLGKMQILRLFLIDVFIVYKDYLFM